MKEFTGVQWMEQYQKWRATIRHSGVFYNCGMHADQKEAVKARDRMIIQKNLPTKLQILKPITKKNKP